jgi:hypothetical protein
MTTKQEIKNQLKAEFPTLQTGNDQDGYVQLSADEYEETISEWADVRLAQAKAEADAELKAQAKAVLLQRLGLTQEEFNTLTA